MVDWVGLLVPLAYLSILIGSLATFSSLYRRRKAQKAANLAPWFPPHLQRNIYLSLLHLDPQDPSSTPEGSEKSLSQVPDGIIRAALLRRAVEDIHRIIQIRNAKPALQTLLQRGSVGDELWQRFLRAEQEIEEEVKDVVSEVRFKDRRLLFGIKTNLCFRPTLSYQTGVRSSSSQPTKSPTTSWPSNAWRTSNPSCPKRRSGGTRESKESRLSS